MCTAILFDDFSRQAGETSLLGYGEAKISAEPAGVPSPAGPYLRDQSLLPSERDPDAAGNLYGLLTIADGNPRWNVGTKVGNDALSAYCPRSPYASSPL